MKVEARLQDIYGEQEKNNEHLKGLVEPTLRKIKQERWHFEIRIKSEESFALKVEAGRVDDPTRLEDFLACVLVVPSSSEIEIAEAQVRENFRVVARRPHESNATRKRPESFQFDDLRLYVTQKYGDTGPPTIYDDIRFEIQIKTFLQHAWSVATHDTVYKTDSVSWRRERVAYQIKAVLEQAEMTVNSIAELGETPTLPSNNKDYDDTNAIINFLTSHWEAARLPNDVKRLSEAIKSLLRSVQLNVTQLPEILDEGKKHYGGEHNLDWSPYRAVLQYLAEQYPTELKSHLAQPSRNGHRKDPIYVPADLLPILNITKANSPNAILVAK